MRIERDGEILEFDEKLPLLPLRDVVLFPQMTVPLLVGRVPSVNAIEEAVAGSRILFATAQRKPDVVDPQKEDLYRLGTVVRVLQLFRLPDGTMRVLVEGLCRARVRRFLGADDYTIAGTGALGASGQELVLHAKGAGALTLSAPIAGAAGPAGARTETRERMSKRRATIARRLVEAQVDITADLQHIVAVLGCPAEREVATNGLHFY